jgi:hypothetical protein
MCTLIIVVSTVMVACGLYGAVRLHALDPFDFLDGIGTVKHVMPLDSSSIAAFIITRDMCLPITT